MAIVQSADVSAVEERGGQRHVGIAVNFTVVEIVRNSYGK